MPERVLNQWLQGINAGDIESVAALYNAEAVLLPTFSEEIRENQVERRRYFQGISARNRVLVQFNDSSLSIQPVADGVFSASGIYRWRFFQGEQVEEFDARFTFILKPGASKPILHHHSSRVPH